MWDTIRFILELYQDIMFQLEHYLEFIVVGMICALTAIAYLTLTGEKK